MIVEVNFGLAGKIRGLTPEKIKAPCDCKVLKVGSESDNYDALIDLCPIHEQKYKNFEKTGIPEGTVLIPGLQVEN